jgi:hypothetical protein
MHPHPIKAPTRCQCGVWLPRGSMAVKGQCLTCAGYSLAQQTDLIPVSELPFNLIADKYREGVGMMAAIHEQDEQAELMMEAQP